MENENRKKKKVKANIPITVTNGFCWALKILKKSRNTTREYFYNVKIPEACKNPSYANANSKKNTSCLFWTLYFW